MGKEFGINTKAQQGRERKAAQKELKKREEENKTKEQEAEEWSVGARQKSSKQTQEELKREERLRQKMETKKLLAAEEAELEKCKPKKHIPKQTSASAVSDPSAKTPIDAAYSDTAKLESSGFSDNAPIYGATNIDDAIFLLDTSSPSVGSTGLERHPERRVRAAYALFEEREMPKLKAEFPDLRFNQLREKLYKSWQRSPDNPFNQSHVAYNITKSEEVLKIESDVEKKLSNLRMSPSP